MSDIDKVTQIFEAATTTVKLLTRGTIEAAMAAAPEGEKGPLGILGAVSVVGAGLMELGNMLSTNRSQDDPVTADQMLFGALFTCRVMPGSSSDDKEESVVVQLDPSILLGAVQDFEKVTGRKPDGFIIPAVINVARELEKGGEQAMADFAAKREAILAQKRAEKEREGRPLN